MQGYTSTMEPARDRIATNLRKGVLEFGVLGLLAQQQMYGLQLAEELMRRELIAGEGSLYPLLARMREAGLIEPVTSSASSGRPRRYYAITGTGRTQLDAFAAIWADLAPTIDELLEERK